MAFMGKIIRMVVKKPGLITVVPAGSWQFGGGALFFVELMLL